MGERKLKGYAAKLVNADGFEWVGPAGMMTRVKESRYVDREYWKVADNAIQVLGATSKSEDYKLRIVAIYSKPKRTAAEERADVVAYLTRCGLTQGIVLAGGIQSGRHVGRSKNAPHVDTDAPQLEALGRANG